MKVYSKLVLDIETGEVLEEDSFEYSGPIAFCGGGGGASGSIEYPGYIESIHTDWLNKGGLDVFTGSIASSMNSAVALDPYSVVVYDPDANLIAAKTAADDFATEVDLIGSATGLDTLVENIISQTRIDDAINAYSDLLQDQLDNTTIPQFQAGMRDINAVMTSAFVIGEAIIQDGKDKNVANFGAQLNLKAWGEDAIRVVQLRVTAAEAKARALTEYNKLQIIAKREEEGIQIEYDAAQARWELEIFTYAGNFLAAPSGGVVQTNPRPNKAASTVSTALSGAAIGAQTSGGDPFATAAGGLLGGLAGYLSAGR